MKISEAIKQLQELQKQCGDLPLKVYIQTGPDSFTYKSIDQFHATAFTPPTVIALYQ
jgi:hypothetical protein